MLIVDSIGVSVPQRLEPQQRYTHLCLISSLKKSPTYGGKEIRENIITIVSYLLAVARPEPYP